MYVDPRASLRFMERVNWSERERGGGGGERERERAREYMLHTFVPFHSHAFKRTLCMQAYRTIFLSFERYP